ncbi:response regulator transcription factor [Parapedobacter defluvii]|uniref:response regulator n=1 Tax=Parapedobacter defluvii TaxID=2045106 RepID=UPI000FA3269B|nr:MAG: DNA-binding response regulator [Parapedobacter sp.]
MSYNILIADDHILFLEGLLTLLKSEEDLHVLLATDSGDKALAYIRGNQQKPLHLLITDISMPGMDGITLNNQVKATWPGIKTLVVSMHTDTSMIDNLVKNDVDGFISKNADSTELLQAIRTILKGGKFFSENVKKAYVEGIFHKEKNTLETLTTREKEVLRLIAEEHTTQEIADKLFLSKHTIESYRKILLYKLNARNLAGLTKYAIKLGLLEEK